MLLLRILSGLAAGRDVSASRFPYSIGRRPESDLSTQDSGLWERHAVIELDLQTGFQVRASSEASVILNGSPVRSAHLRNGDRLGFGTLEFTCWLSPPRQRPLQISEGVTWAIVAAVLVGQICLIYSLLLS